MNRKNTKQLVWYVGYGSNLSRERFECYIKGGISKYSTRKSPYKEMSDPTPPVNSCGYRVPYKIYYAMKRPNWGNGGVAFLDDLKPGDTLGRMWLIKKKQYDELLRLEGLTWYDKGILLGEKEGIPIYTITHSIRYTPDVAPSEGYLRTIEEGLADIFSEDEYRKYIGELSKKLAE